MYSRKEVIHPQLPLRMPCYDFTLIIDPTFVPHKRAFGCCQLSWCDGRWVQDPRTYSTRRIWCAFTSKSNFMQASFSLQSELRPALWDLLHLAIWHPSVLAIVSCV